MGSNLFKMLSTNSVFTNHIYLIYMNIDDLALNNQQKFICHKTQPIKIKRNF